MREKIYYSFFPALGEKFFQFSKPPQKERASLHLFTIFLPTC